MYLDFKLKANMVEQAVSSAVANNVENITAEISKGALDFMKNWINSSKIADKLLASTANFKRSIMFQEFNDIHYANSVYTQLSIILKIICDTISNRDLQKLLKNKKFLTQLGPLKRLFDKYVEQRIKGEINKTKYWALLLTGVPGAGKTVFLKMVHYMADLINSHLLYKNNAVISLFITGSFFLTQEDETKSMDAFIKFIENEIISGKTIVLALDECELIFRAKNQAPAVTLFLEFLSRIRSTINQLSSGKFIVMCATNYGGSLEGSAYRRFQGVCPFNQIGAETLQFDFINKLTKVIDKNKNMLQDNVKDILKHPAFISLIEEFLKITNSVTFGEIDNIISHIVEYYTIYRNLVHGQYIIIIFFALLEFINKESILQNQYDTNLVISKVYSLGQYIQEYYMNKYNTEVDINHIIESWFNNSTLITESFEDYISDIIKTKIKDFITTSEEIPAAV